MNVYKKITLLILVVMANMQAKAQIPTGTKLWLRADTLVTIAGGKVTNWGDCSGNGNNASQSTVALQPIRVLNYKNTKPALYFDGTDIMNTLSIDFTTNQQLDVFFVYKDSQTVNPNVVFELSDNYNAYATGAMFINNYNGFTHQVATYDLVSNNSVGVNTNLSGSVSIINDVLDRSLTTDENICLVNSVQPPSSAYPFNQDVTGNFGNHPFYIGGRGLGNSYLTQGHYLEIIVYPFKLSSSQRNQVVNYLKNKYNITLDAPLAFKGGLADGNSHDSLINQNFPFSYNQYIYAGGINDGSAQDSASTNLPFLFSDNQYIYAGGINDGATHDSLINQIFAYSNNQYIYAGGINDGATHDSLINQYFPMAQNMYAYAGGINDGATHDSLIMSNFPKSINMYAFGGGIGDGWAKRFTAFAGVQSSITCTGGTATISVTASGGIEPYVGTGTFLVTAGTYTYIVSDAAGAVDTLVVKAGPPNAIVPKLVSTPIKCKGGVSTITVSAIGGTAPLSGVGTYIDTAGYHKYIITDANGCKDSIDITITQPSTSVSVTALQDSIICPGSYTTVSVIASGGTPPYAGVGSFNAISNTYTYTVTDANGCAVATTLSVVGSTANLVIASNPSMVHMHDNVTFTSNIVGSAYEWKSPQNNVISTVSSVTKNNVIHSVDSGIYKLTVIDSATGCRLIDTIRLDVRGVYVTSKAFLSGPYVPATGLMRDSLRNLPGFPLTEPYSTGIGMQSPFVHVNGGGGETTSTTRLANTGDSAVVDWVFLELRDALNPAIVRTTKSALLLRNGTIIDANSNSPLLLFKEAIPDNYSVSIKHRNHLGMQSDTYRYFPDSLVNLNWTDNSINTFVAPVPFNTNAAYKLVAGVRTMWGGDINKERRVKYNGTQNDRLVLLSGMGGNANGTQIGYRKDDVNMDGKSRYNGTSNDRLPILQNLSSANSVLNEQTSN